MIYFLLPLTPASFVRHIHQWFFLSGTNSSASSSVAISHSMHKYVNVLSEKIAQQPMEWEHYQKLTNPFEYLTTAPPHHTSSVARGQCTSHFFQLVEIIRVFPELATFSASSSVPPSNSFVSFVNIHEKPKHSRRMVSTNPNAANSAPLNPIKAFHLGSGSVVDALSKFRPKTLSADEHVVLSSEPGSSADKSHVKDVFYETGADGTGNLLQRDNFDECCAKYRHSMDVITAFRRDIGVQSNDLVTTWAQLTYALCLQKPGGHFILQIFDCFSAGMLDILYILSAFYGEVQVAKLQTSSLSSSEKHVICRRFRGEFDDLFPVLRQTFYNLLHQGWTTNLRFLSPALALPKYFVQRVEEMNAVFGQPQLENMHFTLSLIAKHQKFERNDQMVRQNITKCVNWCLEHGIPHIHPAQTSSLSRRAFVRPMGLLVQLQAEIDAADDEDPQSCKGNPLNHHQNVC